MRRLLCAAALAAAVVYGGPASAQKGPPPEPVAVPLDVATCFYECIDSSGSSGRTTWKEVTTLMVGTSLGTNPFGPFPVSEFPHDGIPKARYIVAFRDGNENTVYGAENNLSVGDLDEINICRTLQEYGDRNADGNIPKVGLVSVLTVFDIEGVEGGLGDLPPRALRFLDKVQFSAVWNKNVMGRFNKDETGNEVFSTENRQRVSSIGKTTCTQTPLKASWLRREFRDEIPLPGDIGGDLILIENTDDDLVD